MFGRVARDRLSKKKEKIKFDLVVIRLTLPAAAHDVARVVKSRCWIMLSFSLFSDLLRSNIPHDSTFERVYTLYFWAAVQAGLELFERRSEYGIAISSH